MHQIRLPASLPQPSCPAEPTRRNTLLSLRYYLHSRWFCSLFVPRRPSAFPRHRFFCVLLLTELPTLSQSLPLAYFSLPLTSPTLVLSCSTSPQRRSLSVTSNCPIFWMRAAFDARYTLHHPVAQHSSSPQTELNHLHCCSTRLASTRPSPRLGDVLVPQSLPASLIPSTRRSFNAAPPARAPPSQRRGSLAGNHPYFIN